MKPTKVYYKGELVKTIYLLLDKNKVDIAIRRKKLKRVDRSELLIPLVEAEKQIEKLESNINQIRGIVCENEI